MNSSLRLQILLTLALTTGACSKSNTPGPTQIPGSLDPNSVVSKVTIDRTTGVLANGNDFANLSVTLQDGNQKPISGATISVSVSGSNNIISKAAPTDASGATGVSLGSTTAGEKTVTVTATTQGAGIVLPTQPSVDFVGIVLTASGSPPADGNSPASLTVSMQDSKGVGLAGVPVTLAASGSSNLLKAAYGTTDTNGLFSTTLVSTQAETKTVTATAATMTATAHPVFSATNACQATFQLPSVPWPGVHPIGAFTMADFNRDGTQDAVVTSSSDQVSDIYLGRGDGTFSQAIAVTLDNNTTNLIAVDFNGDKRQDLVGLSNYIPNKRLYVAVGNGDGTFTTPVYYAVNPNAAGLVVNDFDQDTHPDVAVFDNLSNVSVYLYEGNTTFGAPIATAVNATIIQMVTGNFDADAYPDIAFTAGNANLQVMLGNGQGGFSTGSAVAAGAAPGTVLGTAYLDSDTHLDIVTGFQNSNVRVFLGAADGTFQPQPPIATTGTVNSFKLADINNDTLVDIVEVSAGVGNTSNAATALLGSGNGNFLTAQTYALPLSVTLAAIVDINSDHLNDLVGFGFSDPTLVAMLSQPNKAFPSYGWSTGATASAATTASLLATDFNGDGSRDLLVSSQTSSSLMILAGSGDGNFTTVSSPSVGPNVGLSAIGDFNGDKILDVATASNGNSITVVLGKGDGTFYPAYNANTLGVPTAIVAANFNTDTFADIAISVAGTAPVNVLVNTGDGNFMPAVALNANAGAALVAADFTGDGNVDLVLGDQNNSNLSLLAGVGDGTFKAALGVRSGAANPNLALITTLTSADLNQDGKPDILASGGSVASQTGSLFPANPSPSLTVWLNANNGNFTVAAPFGYFSGIGSPSVADVNGDKIADITVSNSYNAVLKVFVGRGNGTFEPSLEYGFGQFSPYVTAVADYNNDGRPDVATLGGSNVQVVLAGPCLVSSPTYFDRVGCVSARPDAIIMALLAGMFAFVRRRRAVR